MNDTINVIECTNIDTKFEEQILLEIINKQTKNVYISCIYRSPNSEALNDNLLYEYIKLITSKNNNDVLIVGDFNLLHINWNCFNANEYIPLKNSTNYRFLKCLNNKFLNQHVLNATRIRGMQNQNILDLIITNGNFIKDIEYQGVYPLYAPHTLRPHTLRPILCAPTLCASTLCAPYFAPPHFAPHTLRPHTLRPNHLRPHTLRSHTLCPTH